MHLLTTARIRHANRWMSRRVLLAVAIVGCLALNASDARSDMMLPRLAVRGVQDDIAPVHPYTDGALRSMWVFSYLNTQGLTTRLVERSEPLAGFNVVYCEGAPTASELDDVISSGAALIQSFLNPALPGLDTAATLRVSDRISLHESSFRGVRVLTVEPHVAEFFENRRALPQLVRAIHRLCGNEMGDVESFGLLPHPDACLTSAIYLVHGEGGKNMRFGEAGIFSDARTRFTYVVSEAALEDYPAVIARRLDVGDEVGIHNHTAYGSAAETIARNRLLHRVVLGNRPRGLVGPYLNYDDDLFHALRDSELTWYLDKDIPYPVNLAGTNVIDITETLKPYDDWWMTRSSDESDADCSLLLELWRKHLAQRMSRWEMSVFHWHDDAMLECPAAFEGIIRYVDDSPQIWQCTASQFQEFWKKRSRVELRLASLTRDTVDFEVENAFPGLTFFARFEDGVRYLVFQEDGDYSGSGRLARLDQPSKPDADLVTIEYSEVMGSSTGVEFVVINDSDDEFANHQIVVKVPDRLLDVVRGTDQEWGARIVRTGIKGLQFETLFETDSVDVRGIARGIAFTAPYIAPRSMSFYRLYFTPRRSTFQNARALVEAFASDRKEAIFLGLVLLLAVSIVLNVITHLRLKSMRRRRSNTSNP